MKIITFSAIKGGVGKTTLAFNYGEWLAKNGKHVLFIDLDHQSNLTQTYNIYDNQDTVGNIFLDRGKVKIHEISAYISLIAGDMHLFWISNILVYPRKIPQIVLKNLSLLSCINKGKLFAIIIDHDLIRFKGH